MSENILEVENLSKIYKDEKGRELVACDEISLNLKRGETLGIVGESGCGKSTLLKLICQLEKSDSGKIHMNGVDILEFKGEKLRLNRRKLQMVFQDPTSSFFSRMKVLEGVSEPLRNFQKLNKVEKNNKVKELLKLVKLPEDYIDRYPQSMSGGQKQRLGIARALILEPEILVCDEATSALDVSVQKEIIELLVDIQKKRDLSIIFVCHDLALVQSLSHRVMVMYLGNIVEVLPGEMVGSGSKHPYTRALVDSIFTVDMDRDENINILEGETPSPIEKPEGCPFSNRCKYSEEICKKEKPKLVEINDSHKIACHIFK